MSEIKPSQIKPVEQIEGEPAAARLAAGAAAEAYQIDYFREYVRGNSRPSDGDRLRAWQKAENTSPQFAQEIAALGSFIPDAQIATDLGGANIPSYFSEIANPIARELLANLLIIRLGSHKSPHGARGKVASLGVREKDAMMEVLRQKDSGSLRLLSTTDVLEAYLNGRLSLNVEQASVDQNPNQDPSV